VVVQLLFPSVSLSVVIFSMENKVSSKYVTMYSALYALWDGKMSISFRAE